MAQDFALETIIVATSEQVSCPLGDEAAILNLKNSVYYGLNPVGAKVWNLVQKPCSVRDLRNAIVAEYEVEPERCEGDLLELLESMHQQGLIQVQEAKTR
jgi:hypothetical protein